MQVRECRRCVCSFPIPITRLSLLKSLLVFALSAALAKVRRPAFLGHFYQSFSPFAVCCKRKWPIAIHA